MDLTIEQRQLVRILLDDYHVLGRDVEDRRILPTPPIIRAVISPILRKWLVEGAIYQLGKVKQTQFAFSVYSSDDVIEQCVAGRMLFWLELIRLFGNRISTGCPIDPSFAVPMGNPRPVDLKTSKFVSQKMIYFEGIFFSRKDIVKFCANKMGGTHLSSKINSDNDLILERMKLFGLLVKPASTNSNVNVTLPGRYAMDAIKKAEANGEIFYSFPHLVLLDSAHLFFEAINRARSEIEQLI